MTSRTITIDREPVRDSFHIWQKEHSAFDAQLTESIAALEAYQSHLDRWQRELVAERDELTRMRARSEHDHASSEVHREKFDEVSNELQEARQEITKLQSGLLERTEELRQLDRQRAALNAELLLAQGREKELAAALEAQEKSQEDERNQWEAAFTRPTGPIEHAAEAANGVTKECAEEPPTNGLTTNKPAKSANPVLGTVMEQFGKLRQQRSLGRPGYFKPR